MKQKIEYNFEGDFSKKCRIASGFYDEGREGQYYGRICVTDQQWAIVLFDGDDDPTLFKIDGLDIVQEKWVNGRFL